MTAKRTLRRPPLNTPRLYEQDGLGQGALVFAHYFLPGTVADWYVSEYNPDEDIAFGWAEILPGCGELGYISLSELEEVAGHPTLLVGNQTVQLPIPTRVEYDRYWTPCTLQEAIANR